MPNPEPVIELEPKNPFRWTVLLALVALWAVALGLGIWLKSGLVRMLLPLILIVLVLYLGFCTFYLLKNRK